MRRLKNQFLLSIIILTILYACINPVEGSGSMMFRMDPQHTGNFNSVSNGISPNGQLRWVFPTGAEVVSSPAVVDGVVYIGSTNRKIYAINVSDGSQKWVFSTMGAVKSSPAVVDNVIYIESDDGKVYAIDALTGIEKWSFPMITGGLRPLPIHSSPTVVDNTVYIGNSFMNGYANLYAIDAITGIKKWSFYTSNNAHFESTPAVANSMVYIGGYDPCWNCRGGIFAVPTSGGWGWVQWVSNSDIRSSPAVVDGVIYYGIDENEVHARDSATGSLKWSYHTATSGSRVRSSPAVIDGTVYVGAWGGEVHAINAGDGTRKWFFSTGGIDDISSPAVADGVVYIGSSNGKIYAIDAEDGTLKWNYSTGGQVFSSPAIADGIVFVGSSDGNVYAIGRPTISVTSFDVEEGRKDLGDSVSASVKIKNEESIPVSVQVEYSLCDSNGQCRIVYDQPHNLAPLSSLILTNELAWTISSEVPDGPMSGRLIITSIQDPSPKYVEMWDRDAVNVLARTVTISFDSDNYSIGDEIYVSGTNTDSDITYLFITGPNLPENGAMLDEIRIPAVTGNPGTFTFVRVDNDYWEYSWDSSTLWEITSAGGEYTIYATSSPNNKEKVDEGIYDQQSLNLEGLPETFDWRDRNIMTKVKSQTSATCWAFATLGSIEAKYNLENDFFVDTDLSEYDLISRLWEKGEISGNLDDGGYLWSAFNQVQNDGVVDESCLPTIFFIPNWPPNGERCTNYQNHLWKTEWKNYVEDPSNFEIKKNIYVHGPLAASIGTGNFHHAVVLVGWDDNMQLWIYKNSWGTSFGDSGYGYWPYDSGDGDPDFRSIFWAENVIAPNSGCEGGCY